jgi:hypothetical protein
MTPKVRKSNEEQPGEEQHEPPDHVQVSVRRRAQLLGIRPIGRDASWLAP